MYECVEHFLIQSRKLVCANYWSRQDIQTTKDERVALSRIISRHRRYTVAALYKINVIRMNYCNMKSLRKPRAARISCPNTCTLFSRANVEEILFPLIFEDSSNSSETIRHSADETATEDRDWTKVLSSCMARCRQRRVIPSPGPIRTEIYSRTNKCSKLLFVLEKALHRGRNYNGRVDGRIICRQYVLMASPIWSIPGCLFPLYADIKAARSAPPPAHAR